MRMQGRLDSPLTERGRAQTAGVAELLERLGVDAMFASPLGRARESVAILNERLGLPVRYDDRLQEWSAGEWAGEFYAEVGGKWPDAWARWQADRVNVRPPRGENTLDLIERGRAFLADPIVAAAGPRVALVAHGFFNKAMAAILLGLPPIEALRIWQRNDAVIRVNIENGTPSVDHFAAGVGPIAGLPLSTPDAATTAASRLA